MERETKPAPATIEKPKIAATQLGLDSAHLAQPPFFERYAFQAHGKVQGSRTYKDGTQYRLFKDYRDQQTADDAPTWKKFVTITPQGIQAIETVFNDQLRHYEQPSRENKPSTGTGRIIWVAYLEDGEQVFETDGGSYGALPTWARALDEAVSQNVMPRSAQ
jgi:hypothetical protein